MLSKKLLAAIVALSLLFFSSCKDDSEDDLVSQSSSVQGLYINEVFTANPDWIELYNRSDAEIDLSGFILHDDKGATEEYIIPAGTKISAKSFLVFNAGQFSFGLSSSNGDKVILFDKNSGKVDEVSIPVISGNQSYARVTDGGSEWAITNPTKGASNVSTPIVEPPVVVDPTVDYTQLVINEVDGNTKFVEIYNKGAVTISLHGVKLLKDDDGTVWVGGETATIAAGGYYAVGTAGDAKTNILCNEQSLTKGISTKKTLRFQLFSPDDVQLDEFVRGNSWGENASDQAPNSFARVPNGTGSFVLATPTCNTVNGVSIGAIPQN
jgi:hypothetical protein